MDPPFQGTFRLHIPEHGYVAMSSVDYDVPTIGPADKATIFTSTPEEDGYVLEFNKDDGSRRILGRRILSDLTLMPKPVLTLPPDTDTAQLSVEIKERRGDVQERFILGIGGYSMDCSADYGMRNLPLAT